MPQALHNAGLFLISTLFDLATFVFLVRIILVAIRADYYNPLSQFIVKLTRPIIDPLKRIIPNRGKIELASVLVVLALEIVKYLFISLLVIGMPSPIGLCIIAMADSLKSVANLFFYAILLQAVLSWMQQGASPMGILLTQITTPIMRPFQRIIPPLGGIDLSPIPAMIVIQLIIIAVIGPLFAMGQAMAFG